MQIVKQGFYGTQKAEIWYVRCINSLTKKVSYNFLKFPFFGPDMGSKYQILVKFGEKMAKNCKNLTLDAERGAKNRDLYKK